MPQRLQKMYSVSGNGDLETVVFLQEQILPGATIPTYSMKDLISDRRFSCSKDMYVETEQEAWERYLKECEQILPKLKEQLESLKEKVGDCEWEIRRTKKRLSLSAEERARIRRLEEGVAAWRLGSQSDGH